VTAATGRLAGAAAWAVILAINALVIAKYAPRVGVPPLAAAAVYAGVMALAAATVRRAPRPNPRLQHALLAALAAAVTLLTLTALRAVPPETLRVDRWSAMTAFNSALLDGRFPYLERTHLGSRVSGLPVACLVGLPFQWLGDVGYLQPAVFVGFVLVCARLYARDFDVVGPLALLAASPAFLWEVAVRSDLLSNAILVAAYLMWCERWRPLRSPSRMFTLGTVLGLLACTRVALLVPLSIYFAGYFRRHEWRAALTMLGPAAVTGAAVVAPFIWWAPASFADNNPLVLQTALAPAPLQVVVIAAALAAGALAKEFGAQCLAGGMVLAGGVAAAFLVRVAAEGWTEAVVHSGFDISYFDLALPFLLVPLLFTRPLRGGGAPTVEVGG
jgi:hypothetical protein